MQHSAMVFSHTFLLSLVFCLSSIHSSLAQSSTSDIPTQIATAPASSGTPSFIMPSCAQMCLTMATSAQPCSETDTACLCSHASSIQASLQSCLSTTTPCSASDLSVITSYYSGLCKALSYSTNTPGTAITSSSSTVLLTVIASATQASAPVFSSLSSNHHLSVPAIAGIAAGSSFLLITIFTLLAYLFFRHRARHTNQLQSLRSNSLPVSEKRLPPPPRPSRAASGRVPTFLANFRLCQVLPRILHAKALPAQPPVDEKFRPFSSASTVIEIPPPTPSAITKPLSPRNGNHSTFSEAMPPLKEHKNGGGKAKAKVRPLPTNSGPFTSESDAPSPDFMEGFAGELAKGGKRDAVVLVDEAGYGGGKSNWTGPPQWQRDAKRDSDGGYFRDSHY